MFPHFLLRHQHSTDSLFLSFTFPVHVYLHTKVPILSSPLIWPAIAIYVFCNMQHFFINTPRDLRDLTASNEPRVFSYPAYRKSYDSRRLNKKHNERLGLIFLPRHLYLVYSGFLSFCSEGTRLARFKNIPVQVLIFDLPTPREFRSCCRFGL